MLGWVDYDRTGRPAARAASLAAFTAAMLCKSSVVMFPAFLLLYGWWRRRRVGWADLRVTAPFWVVSAVLGLVTLWFQSHRAIGSAGTAAGWAERTDQAGWSIVHYFWTGLFPFRLAPVYPPVAPGWPPMTGWVLVAAGLAVLGWRRATWGRHALLGIGWFLLNLLPVLGLIPLAYLRVSPVADHLAYLPLAGVAGLGAAGLGWAAEAAKRRSGLVLGAGAAMLLLLGWTARGYGANFRSERALWSFAVARNPGSWLARNNLGRIDLQEGNPEAALAELTEAIRLQPDSAEARANAGAALERLRRPAEAEGRYREAIRIDPRFAGAHYDLGHFLLLSDRPLEAAEEFRAALALEPTLATAHNNLGLALARLGQPQAAQWEYAEALRLDPRLVEALLNLGNAAFRLGDAGKAADFYRSALRIDPGYAAAHQNLGAALERLGRGAEAQAEFQAAARGTPP
jgi:tetratricopeptide (TPR) repeat protein